LILDKEEDEFRPQHAAVDIGEGEDIMFDD